MYDLRYRFFGDRNQFITGQACSTGNHLIQEKQPNVFQVHKNVIIWLQNLDSLNQTNYSFSYCQEYYW